SFWNGVVQGAPLVEEAWVVIWPEHLATTTFEQGVDQALLAADYQALTGTQWVLRKKKGRNGAGGGGRCPAPPAGTRPPFPSTPVGRGNPGSPPLPSGGGSTRRGRVGCGCAGSCSCPGSRPWWCRRGGGPGS